MEDEVGASLCDSAPKQHLSSYNSSFLLACVAGGFVGVWALISTFDKSAYPAQKVIEAFEKRVQKSTSALSYESFYVLYFVVGHGSAEQRTNLDVMTRNALETNSQQYKEAERELFGRELENEDWDRMEEDERSEKTARLMTRLKEKRKQRLNESGSQQQEN